MKYVKEDMIDRVGDWYLYDDGDVTWLPLEGKWKNRDYWIDAARLTNSSWKDYWIKHLRSKLWWDGMVEDDFEEIFTRSIRHRTNLLLNK